MIRLGLVGSSISHSKSPSIYRDLLTCAHTYDLLDFSDPTAVPSLSSLRGYYGLNVTSPFKTHFLPQLVSFPKKWKAVNCLRQVAGQWEGVNTDATALEELIPLHAKTHGTTRWIVLGDGAMAHVTSTIISELGWSYQQFSRKKGDDFDRFSFFDQLPMSEKVTIINCCSRGLVISGSLSRDWVFWDLNYSHQAHAQTIPARVSSYIDGECLLITQAKHAVKFWGLT